MWPFNRKSPQAKTCKLITREDLKAAGVELDRDREMIRDDKRLDLPAKLAAGRQADAVYQSILNEYFQQRRHDSP